MPSIRFGVNVRAVGSAAEFDRFVRRADDLGYDALAVPDHLGAPSPFVALASAAATSSRLRLRTYVLNVGFWNPALLARDVATLDIVSDGRVELGLGAGHMRGEHDDAGLPWLPFDERVAGLEQTVVEVRRRLAEETHEPRPVQQPVPLLIGAMSRRGLAVAARHADIVGFSGLRAVEGAPPGTFTLCSAAETASRVGEVRRVADGRPYRSDALLQRVVVGREPTEVATEIAAGAPGVTVEQVLDTPFVLLASNAAEGAEKLRRRQELYGFDGVTTHQRNLEALGEVIAAYRRR
jgi:probable F420-dependent oxidoreductase